MNSSEPLQPLTPHEEKLTAYLDGSLPPEDMAAFEQAHPEVVSLRSSHTTLGQMLRKHSESPPLGNGDFFNHQILREIQPTAPARRAATAVPLWRLLFAGACCVLAAVGVMNMLPPGGTSAGGSKPTIAAASAPGTLAAPRYVAEVTQVRAGDHLLTAKLVDADGLAVVWVDGMDKLSSDYVLQ